MALEVENSITEYSNALKQLITEASDKNTTDEAAIACLLSRDKVQQIITEDRQLAPPVLVQLLSLDTRLRTQAPIIVNTVDLPVYRKIILPKPEEWWWWLDQEAVEKEKRTDYVWYFIAGVCWTIAASLALDIVRRLLGTDPDFVGFLAIVTQILLTAGPLTKQGRELAQWLVSLLGVPRRWAERSMAMASILSLLIILFFYLIGMPVLSQLYNNRGIHYLETGEPERSYQAFQRATSLNPNVGPPYYNLATLYEEIADYDQAIELYRKALVNDPGLDIAYNNLARLYLIQGQPAQAFILLRNGLRAVQDDEAQYAIRKNLGWAYYLTEQYDLARDELDVAVDLLPERAPAYYYLALTLEALEDPEAAIDAWKNCLRYIDYNDPEESNWVSVAGLHLEKLREITR